MQPPKDCDCFAHSSDSGRWQPLAEHLHAVARLAAARAAPFGCETLAEVAGLLHDLGKYTTDFQRRLAGEAVRVDHATRGAQLALEHYPGLGQLLAYAIAGHHGGLANGAESGERTALRERLARDGLPPLLDVWRHEIALPETLERPPLVAHSRERGMFQLSFLVRMLFSCLVDADYLDTEAFYDRVERLPGVRRETLRAAPSPSLAALRDRLDAHLLGFAASRPVDRLRGDILDHVRGQAALPPGLFSLTVPTGGGKTLTSLAFALDHALVHGLRRVICVIPFTSIVEQTAASFRAALGELGERAVLEHHSAFVPSAVDEGTKVSDKLRLAMENWDAPIVVTTAVQFFESLFAARPSQCRKLHNIAGSVVILDEAQTLPLKLLRPTVAAIDELARNYGCTLVLCTATQPALNAPEFRGGLDDVRELAPDPPALYRRLERVRIGHLGEVDDAALVARLQGHAQVLCIVNNRRHARALYQAIAEQPGACHLSTLMCARHRSAVLAEVRARLDRGAPCRLVATSLIEAGVDVSFPVVYRAEAGLDSIAQAAGRCNRHGEDRAEDSPVWVFAPAGDAWAPPPELKQFAQAGREVLRRHGEAPLAPAAIDAYFQHLYWQQGDEALDRHDLLGLLRRSRPDGLPLEMLAACYRLIETTQVAVIVPYDEAARGALAALEHVPRCGGVARRLQPYLVQVPGRALAELRAAGAVQPVAETRWGEQFLALMNPDLYSSDFGLWWEEPTFVSTANTII
ncbi:CRISPR-associated endonuclease Cas3'' [Marichromatium bheemlicum]|uniref:CRISPR-associated endonuclease Cas3 n=1 Tax=Marichromatium bheemlicum TaxID=365339 RepID=A0ABX1I376_9GAMM|nr:CRISPR-associated endonuclease Cas3'' [Marichromatium bheemlicum]NKN31880.1 CRISPR-associated endonuclease Cas3'' [Marichromatium bheemlicum]